MRERKGIMNKMSKAKIKIFIFLVVVLMFPGISAHAEGDTQNTDSESDYKKIVQVNYGYVFEDGSMDVFVSAPGVVINDTTVITYDMSSLDFTKLIESRKKGYETVGIASDEIREGFKYALYTDEEKYSSVIEAKVVQLASKIGDILILQTDDKLENSIVLSPKSELNDEEFFAIGFPKDDMDANNFVNSGSTLHPEVNIVSEENGIIEFTTNSKDSYRGGAILNGYNELYGFILENDNNGSGKALSVDTLKLVLEKSGIYVVVADAIVPIDYTEINSVTDAAMNLDTTEKKYTEDSLAALVDKLKTAEEVKNKEEVTQEEIDAASKELISALNGLEEEDNSGLITVIIISVVVCVVLIVIIVLAIKCIKNPDFIYKLLGVKKKEKNSKVSATNEETFVKGVSNYGIDSEVPDTSLLTDVVEPNNELSGMPYLIRISSGERVVINKDRFTIGRDLDVDYRIPENVSISKCHAMISLKNGDWYITDNGSSNKTFVNGRQLRSHETVLLVDNTEIMLATEKMIFRNINSERAEAPFEDIDEMATSVLLDDENQLNSKIPYLVINNKMIRMTKFPFTIGRGKTASYRFTSDVEVSREHFVIIQKGNNYYIRDNGSSNGTMLNNERLVPGKDFILNDGDLISISKDIIEFHS